MAGESAVSVIVVVVIIVILQLNIIHLLSAAVVSTCIFSHCYMRWVSSCLCRDRSALQC
eukprot:COSAG05_NODE_130_length_17165_cov_154.623638_12_plen_59_part_00